MSKMLLLSGVRTGRRVVPVLLLACLLTTGAVAVGAIAGDGGQPDDASDERTDARDLEAGETIDGNLSDADDVDWYAVNATAGEAVVAKLALTNATEEQSVEINVYDPAGRLGTEEERDKMSGPQRVAGQRPGSRRETTAEAPDVAEETGTYYVEVKESRWNETAANASTPYNLTVATEPLDENDPNENGSTATPLEVGGSIEGVMTPYDHEVFAVDLTEGQNYTITFNLTTASSSRFTKKLTLHMDPSKVTDDEPGDGRWGHRMSGNTSATVTAQANGTHYLRLGQSGITDTLLERAEYRLTITPTNSSTDAETDGGTDDGDDSSDEGDTPTDEGDTPTDDQDPSSDTETPTDDAETPTDDAEMPHPDEPTTPTATGAGDATPSETATPTATATPTPTDGDATPTGTHTVTVRGGGGSDDATPTPSPAAGDGPGFGVVVVLVSLLCVTRLATYWGP